MVPARDGRAPVSGFVWKPIMPGGWKFFTEDIVLVPDWDKILDGILDERVNAVVTPRTHRPRTRSPRPKPGVDRALLCRCGWSVRHTPGAPGCRPAQAPAAAAPATPDAPEEAAAAFRRSIGFAPVALLPQLEGGGAAATGYTLVSRAWWQWWPYY